jgi:type II secretory pathway pseudopilin PulG
MFHKHFRLKGFTIIELMLAMTFVSFLLVGVTLLTIQMSNLYARGLTMKEINQAGAEVSDDIRQAIREASITKVKSATRGDNSKVLCTGSYSYITNDPGRIEAGTANVKLSSNAIVRLAKVQDVSSSYCDPLVNFNPILPEGTIELLGGGDRNLVVRDLFLDVRNSALDGDFNAGRGIVTVRLTLSTGVGSELESGKCRSPNDAASGAEYCAIDTFAIVVRAGDLR